MSLAGGGADSDADDDDEELNTKVSDEGRCLVTGNLDPTHFECLMLMHENVIHAHDATPVAGTCFGCWLQTNKPSTLA